MSLALNTIGLITTESKATTPGEMQGQTTTTVGSSSQPSQADQSPNTQDINSLLNGGSSRTLERGAILVSQGIAQERSEAQKRVNEATHLARANEIKPHVSDLDRLTQDLRHELLQRRAVDQSNVNLVESPSYQFTSPPSPFRDEIEETYSQIYNASHRGYKRDTARSIGLIALESADRFYLVSEEDAKAFQQIGKEMLDITLGLDPVTGLGRSTFELLTGRNLITGQMLSGFERSVAFLGVVTAGLGSTVVRTAQAVSRMTHIFERAVHIVEERHKFEVAIRDGKALYAKVEHLISETIIKNKVVNIHTAEKINYDLFNRHLMLGTPPFQAGTHVIQGMVTQETSKFMRFHGDTNQVKGWLFKESSVKGLTREQILDKFSIPRTTTERFYFSEVTLPRGAEYFRGYIQGHGGAPSGAVQWYVKDIKTEWFANKKLIE